MEASDTITALATATGQSGVAVIRVSGPIAPDIALAISGVLPRPRMAELRPFFDQDQTVLDEGLVLYFPAPHSFTGEDVVEFQGHGGMVVQNSLLKRIVQLGARLARPGEFSERAFLNDKMDLTQAEAIADLIAASSEQAAKSAVRSLQGEFANMIHQLTDQLIHLRIFVEAAIDFPEEEIDFLSDGNVSTMLDTLRTDLDQVMANAKQGALLRDGIRVVIAGRPNAGKSSLLNVLSGEELAIVTDIPGTTRDVLREHIVLDGLPMHIIDTAGLRTSNDLVEQEGVRRAWKEIENADCILLVEDVRADDSQTLEAIYQRTNKEHGEHVPLLIIKNKVDLLENIPESTSRELYVSAHSLYGMDNLKETLKRVVGFVDHHEGGIIARRRHLDALALAKKHFAQAEVQLREFKAGELVAEELRLAQVALGEITGEFSSDDLLGKIFSSFCIGK